MESFAGSSFWNIFLDRFSGNIQLLDPHVDVKWMRTDPVFIMKQMKNGCKPIIKIDPSLSSLNIPIADFLTETPPVSFFF